jgi:hypothetical protein
METVERLNEPEVRLNEPEVDVSEEQKPYTLRGLKAKDIAPVATIIKKIGVKELKNCFENDGMKKLVHEAMNSEGGLDQSAVKNIGISVAFDVADIILTNLPACQDDVNVLLADMSGMKKAEVEDLPLGTYTEMIIDVIRQDGFKDFMKAVSKLTR